MVVTGGWLYWDHGGHRGVIVLGSQWSQGGDCTGITVVTGGECTGITVVTGGDCT